MACTHHGFVIQLDTSRTVATTYCILCDLFFGVDVGTSC